ncbi:VWA domain-containing protein [Catellatospora methionotrophica]|uniref:VWA domain-containing protein n=1 Tax=Catellatospora methionotrophica TaxID=121620 RepID=A0A8J3LBB2_9ACTN|nr:substrate-binding domain-containing protein [Catellatospora methionotrophica]GIG15590.1 VWA domain-containing protein [Catellatospora methionotrophica]
MDSTVVAALIGAAGAVVAALIGLVAVLLGARRAGPGAPPDQPVPVPGAPGRPGRGGGQRGPRRAWWPPNRVTAVVALTTVAIVGLVVLVVVVVAPPGGCQQVVPLSIASSTEKDELLRELATAYGSDGEAVDGVCAKVTVTPVSSGDALEGLTQGWGSTERTEHRPAPDVWTPTSSMWVSLYFDHLGKPAPAPSPITRSPVVIALPKTIALALGWPDKPMNWKDLRALVTDPAPWLTWPGLPAGQPFTIGKDNPKYSTSGLGSTVAAYYAANQELNASHDMGRAVADEKVTNYVRSLESGVTYTHDVMDLLANLGHHDALGDATRFLSGIVMQEELVYLYNSRDREVFGTSVPDRLNEPLYTFLPGDGLLDLDHPYLVLSDDTRTQSAAESFRRFLVADEQQAAFTGRGFRDLATDQLDPRAQQVMNVPTGALPPAMAAPDGATLAKILAQTDKLRRKARVLLVLDVSGSMGDVPPSGELSKLALVKNAVVAALDQLNPFDEVGLLVFSSKGSQTGGRSYTVLQETAPLKVVKQRLVATLTKPDGIVADGGTALYDAVRTAVARMSTPRTADWVNAVVVLSDGKDTASPAGQVKALAGLATELRQNELKVPVYTIGYGLNNSPNPECAAPESEDPEAKEARQALVEIASATLGGCYNASADRPTYINKVFVDVFRHF